MSSRAPLCLIITVCSHFKSPLAMYLLHLRRWARYNSEVWLVMPCTYCTGRQPWDVFSDLCYFPWLVFRLHCITVHFIEFRLRSTLAFRLHCKTISGEVMLCCLLSSLGLQVFSTWILNCICVKFFRVFFNLCLKSNYNRIRSDELLMTSFLWSGGFDWLQRALIGLLPWDQGWCMKQCLNFNFYS